MSLQQKHSEWPSADDQHELQTLKGKIFRRSVLGSLYFVWVCGLVGIATMVGFSLYAITRSILSLNAVPVPQSVVCFLTFMALYETYHWFTPGPHRWDAVRRFLHYMFTKYPYFRRHVCIFEEELEKQNESRQDAGGEQEVENRDSDATHFVKPDDKSLFAFHPHGILSCGFGMNGIHHTKFSRSNTRWLVADNLFWFPIMRDILYWMDSSSVKKETFVELMTKGNNIGFLPGGFEDATLYERGKHRVFLKNRFGFIKLALQFGYKVHPAYTFGEEHTFDAFPYFLKLRLKLNEFKLPAAVFMGSPWCFFMPRSDVDLITVVGKPLELPQIAHPTKQEVQHYHSLPGGSAGDVLTASTRVVESVVPAHPLLVIALCELSAGLILPGVATRYPFDARYTSLFLLPHWYPSTLPLYVLVLLAPHPVVLSSTPHTNTRPFISEPDIVAPRFLSSSSMSNGGFRRRPQWPQATDLPQLQTFSGAIWRRALVGGTYCLWVCGLLIFGSLYVSTFVCIGKTLWSGDATREPIPPSVCAFVAFLIVYESYQWLFPVREWDRLQQWTRAVLTKYPYFRFNACVFEEELLAQQREKNSRDATLGYDHAPFAKPNERAMYALHPHGVLSCGSLVNGIHHAKFANVNARWLVADNLFWFPFIRDVLNWWGFSNVTRRSFTEAMDKQQNIGFSPGGFEEATLYERGKHRVFLKKRFGFIKLALQYGYKIHPVYTFGEELTYHAFPYFLELRLKLNAFKFPGVAFFGSFWCFFMPRSDIDLITVVGKPLQLPKIAHPTEEEVQHYHALYVSTLEQLFETHKKQFAANPDAKLEVY